MKHSGSDEGLKIARFLMVLASISPLFIFWAIQGNSLLPDRYVLTACATLVVLPNVFLWLRFRTARRLQERREIVVGKTEDHRDHLLVYLFAMLLPCTVHTAQASLRSKRLRGVDPGDAAQRQQRAHGRCDQRDRGADHKRTGTDGRQDRVCATE
jgi:hypothetical protein